MTSPTAAALLRALLGPGGPEVGCDECFAELDVYVEAASAGRDGERLVPGMTAHLAGCPACFEEYESMRALATAPDSPEAR